MMYGNKVKPEQNRSGQPLDFPLVGLVALIEVGLVSSSLEDLSYCSFHTCMARRMRSCTGNHNRCDTSLPRYYKETVRVSEELTAESISDEII